MNLNQIERLDHLLGLDDVSREEYHELRGLVLELCSEYRETAASIRRQRARVLTLEHALRACVRDIESTIEHNRTPGNRRTVSEVLLVGMECHRDAARKALNQAENQ